MIDRLQIAFWCWLAVLALGVALAELWLMFR